MHPRLEARLNAVRADFEKWQGKPFRHFYCPILHVDERVPLQMGHIISLMKPSRALQGLFKDNRERPTRQGHRVTFS